jgi:hypothetical protein
MLGKEAMHNKLENHPGRDPSHNPSPHTSSRRKMVKNSNTLGVSSRAVNRKIKITS